MGAQQEMFPNISWNKSTDALSHFKYYGKKVRKIKSNETPGSEVVGLCLLFTVDVIVPFIRLPV